MANLSSNVLRRLDSCSPLGSANEISILMQLGEILLGSGLATMVLKALLAVFVAGLMVGRTPEYRGKKIEAREIKLALLALLVFPASLLGFAAVAAGIAARA